ncbi:hypothetical protein SAMN05216312_110199 [Cohnella sp. OV330]|uniref:hypothetical protein n=1 Tax=Cohnella sp. OV330 TaxID=1855288 RepID=UPI0008E47274|nr:hypothetical protein [Cohnella sp. OV330]SFB50199.1 hypothetical protein SAMN05216312_110199 [Cohnella sp. OV330]
MFKSAVYAFILLVLTCTSCAPLSGSPSKEGLLLEQQSLVRWRVDENILEVYAVIANYADKDASFAAYVVFLDPHLREIDGLDRIEVKEDDRKGKTPFLLKPYQETVLRQRFYMDEPLKRAWLSKGVGIEIATEGKRMTLPIKYVEIR